MGHTWLFSFLKNTVVSTKFQAIVTKRVVNVDDRNVRTTMKNIAQ